MLYVMPLPSVQDPVRRIGHAAIQHFTGNIDQHHQAKP